MRDSTRQGMQSVTGNMSVLEKCIQNNTLMLRQLEKALKDMQTQFAGSTKTVADQSENIAMMEALKKEVDELKAKLIELENVKKRGGDMPFTAPSVPRAAAMQFNGLGMSIQQVARELPSLTMGANMFFLAISNNLPILADNIKQARTEYDLLKKSNQAATPVWKQVVSSIFSWQTAMVVGITMLTLFGKEIGEWVKGLFRGKEALEQNRIAVESLSQARLKGAQSAQTELTRLKLLYQATQNDALGKREQLKAVKELQDKYPSYFGNLSAEEILAGNAAKAYKSLAAAIIESAKARAYEEKMIENEKKILELDDRRIGALVEETKAKQRFDKANTLLENLEGNPEAYDFQLTVVEKAREKMNEYGNEAKRTAGEMDGLRKANEKLAGKITPSDLLFEIKPDKEPKGDISIDNISAAEFKARQKIEAMKIAIMAEGAAKEKKEARARFDAELVRIDQEEKERLAALAKSKKNGLPVSKEQVTAVTDQSGKQRKGATELYIKEFFDIEKEYADKQKKDFDKLLEKYQDYTARRVDIEKTFNADIAKLQAERDAAQQKGDTKKVDQMNRAIVQATTNKGKELMGLDYEQLKQTPEYVRAFENLKETSSDTLDSLLSQFENAKQTAAEVLSPDELREYTTTIQEIMDELDSRNPFGALADRKKELAEAEAELAKAQQQLIAVQSGAQIVTGVKNPQLNDKTGKIESEKTYLTATKAMENYNKAQDNVAKKGAKVEKAEREVKDVMDDLFNSIKDVGAAIGGPAGEIIGLIGDIGLFTMTAMNGVSTASETASKSIQAVEKASVILAIIGAAIQIAMKIASLFKGDDGVAAYEDAKDVYESYIDILDRVIEKQKELFELNSKTGEQAYEKAKETVKLQEDASRELGKQYLNSGASKGFLGIGSSASKGVDQRDDMSWKAKEEAQRALGQSGYNQVMDGRMTGLFDLSAKQLADLQEKAPLFWAELHDDTRTYLEQIIACGDELKQIEDDRKEGLTKTDFESFYSGFLDTLNDMDASSEDFANSFEDYLKKAILSSLITNEYKTRIQALYDNWASYTKSGEKLTEQEVEALRKEQESITEEMLRKREELAKTFGWESEAKKEQQSGKAGSFTTMSQDQGTKLEGLFTSVQGHVSNIDDLMKDIAMAMYDAFDTLLRIEANTAYCRHLEQMATDIAELKRDGFKMK